VNHPLSTTHPWRLITLLVVAILGLALVTPRPAAVQEEPSSALAAHVALPNALAIQFFTAIGGDSAALMLSTDAVLHTPEGTFTGVTGPAQFGEELGTSFSNVQFAENAVVQTSDGFVIASFTLTGINTGSYRGMDANCAAIAVPGAAFFRLSEREVVSSFWASLPEDMRSQVPPYVTVTQVTEQWLNYDADVVASQIAAFNELDPNTRPGCVDESADAPDLAPTCPSPRACELPY